MTYRRTTSILSTHRPVFLSFYEKEAKKNLLLLQAVYDCVTMVLLDYRVIVRFFVAHLFLAR